MKEDVILPTDIKELHAIIVAQQEEISSLKQQYRNMLEQFKLAQQRKYARSSESNMLQQELQFDEAEASFVEDNKEQEEPITITYTRNKPKRRVIPAHLPREIIEHDIDEGDKQCACGCIKKRIGEEVTEQLEIIPQQLKVIAHVRFKYACNRCDEKVNIAPLPKLFLPKTMASPSLVAHTIVNKYQHHLPLYRQEKIWQDLGIELPRNTVCGWIMAAYDVCKPLREVLWQEIIKSGYIQADETPLQVMNEPGRSNTQKSYMWVYQSLADKPLILFDYRPTRQALWPQEMLADFKGYLQTDGYKGYDWVRDKSNIIHLGCMVHARRPFAEMVKLAKKTGKSHQAIALFQKLYAIEKYARDNKMTHEQRYQLRQEKQKPILDELFAFVDKSLPHAAPQSKLQNALLYIKQRQAELSNYLLNGMLEIDNNLTENQIRPFALGRKNWLFSASPNGAHASAFFYSLIASASANSLNPFDYLHHLFLNIRSCKSNNDFINLLPTNIILTNK